MFGVRSVDQLYYAVTNDYGTTYSEAATLTVLSPPVITKQPENYVGVESPLVSVRPATFSLTAVGPGTVTYQWEVSYLYWEEGLSWYNPDTSRRIGYEDVKDATDSTLEYRAWEERTHYGYDGADVHSGTRDYWFRCKVSNDYGSIYSTPVSMTVTDGWQERPIANVKNRSVKATIGKSVYWNEEFWFASSYQLQVSGNGGLSWQNVNNGDYAITHVHYYDSGYHDDRGETVKVELKNVTADMIGKQYRILAGNQSSAAFSGVTTLEEYVAGPTKPVIDVQPSNTLASVGGSASFSVTSANASSYRWQVSTNNGSSWSNINNGATYHNVNTATLTIDPVMAGYFSYQYRCAVTNAQGTTNSKAAKLTVQ